MAAHVVTLNKGDASGAKERDEMTINGGLDRFKIDGQVYRCVGDHETDERLLWWEADCATCGEPFRIYTTREPELNGETDQPQMPAVQETRRERESRTPHSAARR